MRYWTEVQDAAIREGLVNKVSARLIGESIGRTKGSVLARMSRLRDHDVPAYTPAPKPERRKIKNRQPEPVQTPISRDPCWRCGVRGDVGCVHSRAAA